MRDEELAAAFGALRVLCTNIIGFDQLVEERDKGPIAAADLVRYEAHVYAGGVELAGKVMRLADELARRINADRS